MGVPSAFGSKHAVRAGGDESGRVSVELGSRPRERRSWRGTTSWSRTRCRHARNSFQRRLRRGHGGPGTPGAPAIGTWTIANSNGSVLVRASARGPLAGKPVEIQQSSEAVNSVSLSGTVNGTPPTTGVWRVTWRSLMKSPNSPGPSFANFAPIILRDSNSLIIASLEYR